MSNPWEDDISPDPIPKRIFFTIPPEGYTYTVSLDGTDWEGEPMFQIDGSGTVEDWLSIAHKLALFLRPQASLSEMAQASRGDHLTLSLEREEEE